MPVAADDEKHITCAHAEVEVVHAPQRKWQSYIWDSLDKSPEEREVPLQVGLSGIDVCVFGRLDQIPRSSEHQQCLRERHVSKTRCESASTKLLIHSARRKEDLGLYGDQLNYMQTCWIVGYVIGQLPSNLILTRVRPSLWIPTLELIWTICTFSLSRCNTAEQIYAVRFLVGLAESGFYPGMQYVIGSWYKKDELAKRSCIFHTSSGIAQMFSGYLMAAVYHLEGVGGFRGWQWLFLVDGIISLPIALAGYFMLPDHPENTRALYFTPEERASGRKRMEAVGRRESEPYTKAKVWKILSSWHIWVLTLLYICFNNGNKASMPAFSQWLKQSQDPKYEVWQINVYPTTAPAVQVITTLIYAWTSDSVAGGQRWPFFIFGGCVNIMCYVSLAIWDIPLGWKWACFVMAGCGYGLSGLCFAWAHEICSDDNEERALVTGSTNELAYVFQA